MKIDNPFNALASDSVDTFSDPTGASYEFNFSQKGSATPSSRYLNPPKPSMLDDLPCQKSPVSDQETPLFRESSTCLDPMETATNPRRSSSISTIVVRADTKAWNYNIILPTWPPAAVYYGTTGISYVGDNIIIPWNSVLKNTSLGSEKSHSVSLQRSTSLPLIDYFSSISPHEAPLDRNAPLSQLNHAKSPTKHHVDSQVESGAGYGMISDEADKHVHTYGNHQPYGGHGKPPCLDPSNGCDNQEGIDTSAERPHIAKVRSHQRELSERNIILRDGPASKSADQMCDNTKSETDLSSLRQQCEEKAKVAAMDKDEGFLIASDLSDDDEIVMPSEIDGDEVDWDHWDWEEDMDGVELASVQ